MYTEVFLMFASYYCNPTKLDMAFCEVNIAAPYAMSRVTVLQDYFLYSLFFDRHRQSLVFISTL